MLRPERVANFFPMTAPTQSPAGQALRILREEAGLTAKEVAQRAGVSESYLSRVENGSAEASAAWTGNVAAAIARALVESAARRPQAVAS